MLKLKLLILLIFAGIGINYSQENFTIKNSKKSTRLKFELVNNLIIVPVELNGLQLSFLVDTGVKTTVLLNMAEEDTTQLNPFEKIQLRGLGGEDLIQAFRSRNNRLKMGKVENKNLDVFVIYDDNINFSPRLGVPVHGIIGYDLFKDFVVEINYPRRFLRLHDRKKFRKKLRGYDKLPLQFYQDKPYVTTRLEIDNKPAIATLLLDNGLSDAVWLFPDSTNIFVPERSYPDFLGLGLSGDVTGQRARITSMQLGENTLQKVTASFPDSLSIEGLQTYHARNGSIGSEIMRRFNIVFDYNSSAMYLQPNKWFEQEFHYDMSGIVLEHSGFTVVESLQRIPKKTNEEEDNILIMEPAFYKKFELKPAFEIARLRKNSPALLSGLQVGDEVTKVNGRNAYKMNLNDFVNLFSSEEGKNIKIEVLRNGQKLTFSFELKEP
ncbi:MAG: aspartyl protease family protein [Salinimicrobium sediminis]|nr:aspartyl protease family protein [Salinimicrobium sediminis]